MRATARKRPDIAERETKRAAREAEWEAKCQAYIARLVDGAPPFSPDQVIKLRAILGR